MKTSGAGGAAERTRERPRAPSARRRDLCKQRYENGLALAERYPRAHAHRRTHSGFVRRYGLRYSPDEILAVAAERRLLEEARYELVVLDDEDVLFLEGTLATALLEAERRVEIARARSVARLARVRATTTVLLVVRHL